MRVLVLSLFVGVALAAPQGYNYQVNPGANNNAGFPLEQLQLGQQLSSYEQQQQVQQPHQQALTADHLQPPALPQPQLQLQPQPQLAPQPQPQPLLQLAPQPQPQPLPQLAPQPQPQPLPQLEPQLQPQPLLQLVPQLQPQPQPHFQPTNAHVNVPAPAKYKKEFYYLSAPRENFELPHDFQDQLKSFKKNLRVIFVKAPEHTGIENAALQLVKQSQQSNTVVYVLTKQHNAADLAKKLDQLRVTAPQKPEVVFVKYRTPEEAELAQRTIQSQYESLDGPNYFNYEGSVPTHNFIGSTEAKGPQTVATKEAVASPLDYLPPAE